MPNWCNNTIQVYHPDQAKLRALVEAFNKGEMCEHIWPVPESLKIVAGRVGDDDNEDQKRLVEQTEANLEKHGYGNWYDFCVGEWGTKWDVGGDGMEVDPATVENDVTLCFDSAWAPPTAIYEKMLDLGFSITAYYYEGGMAFCGKWWDGDDDYYEIGGLTAEQVRDTIPEDLDECMGISESIEMWKEENQEEEE